MQDINTRGTFVVSRACIPHLSAGRQPAHPHAVAADQPRAALARPAYRLHDRQVRHDPAARSASPRSSARPASRSNALWPRTLIATAAVQNLLGGDEAMAVSRKPEFYADAAYAVLTRPSRECTGNTFLCEDVLAEDGRHRLRPVRVRPRAPRRRSICSSTTCERTSTGGVRSSPERWLDSPSSPGSHRRCRSSRVTCCRAAPELARGMAEHLYATIPELSSAGRRRTARGTGGSSAANIGQVLRLLAPAPAPTTLVVPHEALEYLRGNVRRGIPLAALLRSYRLGHAWLWARWSRALQERIEDSGELAAATGSELSLHVRLRRQGLPRSRRGVRHRARAHDARRVPAPCRDGARDPRGRAGRRGGRLAAARAMSFVATTSRCASRAQKSRSAAWSAPSARPPRRSEPESRSSLPPARHGSTCGVGAFAAPATDALQRYEPPPGVLVAFGRPGRGSPASAARTPRRSRPRGSGRSAARPRR